MGLEDEDLTLLRKFSLTVESLFGLRIVVCNVCGTGLPFKNVRAHLGGKHRRFETTNSGRIEKENIASLTELLSRECDFNLSSEAEIKEAEKTKFPTASNLPPPFPYLEMQPRKADELDGPFLCKIKGCSDVFRARTSALNNFKAKHREYVHIPPEIVFEKYQVSGETVGIQRLFTNGTGCKFFAVDACLSCQSTSPTPLDFEKAYDLAIEPLLKRLEEEKKSREKVVPFDREINSCPLEKHVRWRSVIKSLGPQTLFRSSVPPQANEEYLQVQRLRKAVKDYYTNIDQSTWFSVNHIILEGLYKHSKRRGQFLMLQNVQSRITYARWAFHLIVFLLRYVKKHLDQDEETEVEVDDSEHSGRVRHSTTPVVFDRPIRAVTVRRSREGNGGASVSRRSELAEREDIMLADGGDDAHAESGDYLYDSEDSEDEDAISSYKLNESVDYLAAGFDKDTEDFEDDLQGAEGGKSGLKLRLTDRQLTAARHLLRALNDSRIELQPFIQELAMTLICEDNIVGERRSAIEIFMIAKSIDKEGRRMKLVDISPNLSRCQYFILLAILKTILSSGSDQHQSTFDKLTYWADEQKPTVFAYNRTLLRITMAHIGRSFGKPSIHWDPNDVDRCSFRYKGQKENIESLQHMYVIVYEEAWQILFVELLFGISLKMFNAVLDVQCLGENCSMADDGWGIPDLPGIKSHRLKLLLAKRNHFFETNTDGLVVPNKKAWQEWGAHLHGFKRRLYILFHGLCGPPRRLREETTMRDRNYQSRNRAFYVPHSYLELVGGYWKGTSTTNRDNSSLSYAPSAVAKLYFTYVSLCRFMEEYYVREVCDGPKSSDWDYYWLQTDGKKWTTTMLSKFIVETTTEHLDSPLKPAALRQILASVVDRFQMGYESKDVIIGHSGSEQEGNAKDSYFGSSEEHVPHLDRAYKDRVFAFSKTFHAFFGFDGENPRKLSASEMCLTLKYKKGRLVHQLEELVEKSQNRKTAPEPLDNGQQQIHYSLSSSSNIPTTPGEHIQERDDSLVRNLRSARASGNSESEYRSQAPSQSLNGGGIRNTALSEKDPANENAKGKRRANEQVHEQIDSRKRRKSYQEITLGGRGSNVTPPVAGSAPFPNAEQATSSNVVMTTTSNTLRKSFTAYVERNDPSAPTLGDMFSFELTFWRLEDGHLSCNGCSKEFLSITDLSAHFDGLDELSLNSHVEKSRKRH